MPDHVSFGSKWRVFEHINSRYFVMVQHSPTGISYSPLYLYSFRFPRYMDTEPLHPPVTIADKLRYYRNKKSLRQQDVADYLGIERATYSGYEDDSHEYYPLDVLERIAVLLEVDFTELLDDYHLFLHKGQGNQVRALRESKGLTQRELAEFTGVWVQTVKRWEHDKVRMTRESWGRVFGA